MKGAVEDTELIKSLGKFDIIYSTFSLHHWSDPVHGIKNLYEALNTDSVIFICDFYRGGLLYYINVKRGVWESIRAFYRLEEIREIFGKLSIDTYTISRIGIYMDIIIRNKIH